MDNSPIRPIVSFYIFLLSLLLLISALFTHLALVYNIKTFQDFRIDILFLLPILIVFILIPKDIKIRIGVFVMPILLYLLVASSRKASIQQLEEGLKKQEFHRREQDEKIKSNPILHTLVTSLIIILVICFVLLNIYILKR
jgi:hypothetical protein